LLSTQDAILALKATDWGRFARWFSKGDNLEIMALPVTANQVPQACRFIIAIDPESHCNN
jgi:hypothetical protein